MPSALAQAEQRHASEDSLDRKRVGNQSVMTIDAFDTVLYALRSSYA